MIAYPPFPCQTIELDPRYYRLTPLSYSSTTGASIPFPPPCIIQPILKLWLKTPEAV